MYVALATATIITTLGYELLISHDEAAALRALDDDENDGDDNEDVFARLYFCVSC